LAAPLENFTKSFVTSRADRVINADFRVV